MDKFKKSNPFLIFFLLFLCNSCIKQKPAELINSLATRPFSYEKEMYSGENWLSSLLYAEGVAELKKGNFQQAEEILKKHLFTYPSSELNSKIFQKLGQIYFNLKNYALAAEYFSKFIKISTDFYEHKESYFMAGFSFLKANQYNESIIYFEKMKESFKLGHEELAVVNFYTGFAYFQIREVEKAEKLIENEIDYIYNFRKYFPRIEFEDLAMGFYILGEISYERLTFFKDISEEISIADFLSEKKSILRDLEDYYTKAINLGFSDWSLASFYKLSKSYDFIFLKIKENYRFNKKISLEKADKEKLEVYESIEPLLLKAEQILSTGLKIAEEGRSVNPVIADMKQLSEYLRNQIVGFRNELNRIKENLM